MRICCIAGAAPAPAQLLCLFSFCVVLPLAGCGDDTAKQAAEQAAARHRDAIRRAIDLDAALGKARDQALGKPKSLGEVAAGVRQYVAAMSAVDLHDLPEDVQVAYRRHLETWRAAGDLFDHYSGLSGAFRVGVDGEAYAKSRVDAAQAAVKDSWNEVRAKAKAYGVENIPD